MGALIGASFGVVVIGCSARAGGQSGTDALDVVQGSPMQPGEPTVPPENPGGTTMPGTAQPPQTNGANVDPQPPETTGGSIGPEPMAPTGGEPAAEGTPPIVDPAECVLEVADVNQAGITALYTATDELSTACITEMNAPERICFSGTAVDAGPDYLYWGGGIGLALASEGEDGVVPFDAEALGIHSLQLEIADPAGTLDGSVVLRAYLNMVDSPDIADPTKNYQHNSFVGAEVTSAGSYTIALSRFALPEWTSLDADDDGTVDVDTPLDASRLNSLQFFVASVPGRDLPYDVCIVGMKWLDIDGKPVEP